MRDTFPNLDTQTLLFWEYVPDINYPLVELFSSYHHVLGKTYFVQMSSVEGFGVASKSQDENEARTTYSLWTRGLQLPEDVFAKAEGKS